MQKIFYCIDYNLNGRVIQLFGHVATSYASTVIELQGFGVDCFTTQFLTKDELDTFKNSPYPISDNDSNSSRE